MPTAEGEEGPSTWQDAKKNYTFFHYKLIPASSELLRRKKKGPRLHNLEDRRENKTGPENTLDIYGSVLCYI